MEESFYKNNKPCKCCGSISSVVVAPKIGCANDFFLFRNDGVEVSFKINKGVVSKPSHFVTHKENKYIKKHIIPNHYE